MELLDQHTAATKAVHDYFGYDEDWVVIPLNDSTEYYWQLVNPVYDDDSRIIGGEVRFAESIDDFPTDDNIDADNYYEHEIYTQRFLPKWVYEGEDYTMISVDTHTDGNKFLQIFDNALRCDPDGINP